MEFLVFIDVMRRPCWCTKQWQNVAQVLRNNKIKSQKTFFAIVLYTNMAAVTSRENREYACDDITLLLLLYMAAAFSFLDLQVKKLVAILDCFKSFAFDLGSQ